MLDPFSNCRLNNTPTKKVDFMQGERVLISGLLSKDISFSLIVSGSIAAKEMEYLIKILELQEEILAEPEED